MSLREKCPYSELFWSVFSPNAKKIHTRKTSNTDTFHAVCNCFPTVPSAIWGIFSEFLKFCNLFHKPLGEESFCQYCTRQRIFCTLFICYTRWSFAIDLFSNVLF